MGNVSDLINSAIGVNVLDQLAKKMHVKHIVGRRILAALVFDVLRSCDCGLTTENEKEVKKRLCYSIAPYIEFEVYIMAAQDSVGLLQLLRDNVPELQGLDLDTLYTDYIYPFLRENEVMPGVRLAN